MTKYQIHDDLTRFDKEYIDMMTEVAARMPVRKVRTMCRLLRPEWEEMGIWDELITRISKNFNG